MTCKRRLEWKKKGMTKISKLFDLSSRQRVRIYANRLVVIFVCLMALALPSNCYCVSLHPNHVTLTEIEFNSKSSSFEISICLWPEDIETIVSKLDKNSGPLDLGIINKYMPEYLKDRFVIRSKNSKKNDKPLPIRWVGSELTLKKAWLFLEIKTEGTNQTHWSIENKILFEEHDDQSNQIKFKREQSPTWFACTSNKSKFDLNPIAQLVPKNNSTKNINQESGSNLSHR